MSSIHIRITGPLVQGVFFRAHGKEKGLELGLKGWVRNAEDESVEIYAEGDDAALKQLEEWCHEGPPAAQVESVEAEACKPEECEGFVVRY